MDSKRTIISDASIAAGVWILTVGLGALIYQLVMPGFIDAAFSGKSGMAWANDAVSQRHLSDPYTYDQDYFHWMGRTFATRLAVLWFACLALILGWRHRNALTTFFYNFFREKDTPLNLAIFRIVIFGLLFFSERDNLAFYSSLPEVLHFPPIGLGPVLAKLPASPEIATYTLLLFKILCVLALLGVFTRITTITTTILALYVLGIPQMFGKVNHAHHMVWFAAILASSPCGDALSIDSLVRRMRGKPTPQKAIAYTLPLHFVWILLGLIYFFPGFWKLWGGGVDWIFGDHLRNQMYHLWSTHTNDYSIPWLAESKVLNVLGGLGTIFFEVFFICFIFTRRMRVLALLGGLAFHNAVGITLRIGFYTLQWCYVSFIDWQWIKDRFLERPASAEAPRAPVPNPLPTTLIGLVIIIPTLWLGFIGENNGWPFACYPRFSYPIFKPERSIIEFDIVDKNGNVTTNKLEKVRSQFRTARWVGLVRSVLKTEDTELRNRRLDALGQLALGETDPNQTLRFYRATYSTIPDDWGNDPTKRVLLAEITISETNALNSQSN